MTIIAGRSQLRGIAKALITIEKLSENHNQHHFVPKVNLKKWISKKQNKYFVDTLLLYTGKLHYSDIMKVARKTNLYALPDDVSIIATTNS